MPIHSHVATATAVSTDSGHTHTFGLENIQSGSVGNNVQGTGQSLPSGTKTTNVGNASITTTVTVTNANSGAGQAHNNIQPSYGIYYIMYIP